MAISMAIGTSLSGIVYNKLGFYGAYGISSALLLLGLFYGTLYVKESGAPVAVPDTGKWCRTAVSEFFNLKHVTQSLRTTFRRRPNTQRLRILILLIILMTSAGTNNGWW